MSRRVRSLAALGLAAGVLAAAGCGQDTAAPIIRNLNRPTEMAFACWGELRLPDGTVRRTAQPLASCEARVRGEVPPGQEDLVPPEVRGFVLETARGTIAVVNPEVAGVVDSDPLTPGKNSIPVGTLPVGLDGDGSGCFMVTASSGTCELAALEVNSALELTEQPRVSQIPITAGGERLRARPHALASFGQTVAIGEACPATPTGVVYVAYPECHLVAAIDAATGEVRAGLSFAEDGSIAITDGNVSCPVQCADGSLTPTAAAGLPDAGVDAGPEPDAGAPPPDIVGAGRPVTLTLGPDGLLYVGAEDQNRVVAVTLDAAGLPTATTSFALEGEVGVTRVAVSDEVAMGGDSGAAGDVFAGEGGTHRFAYAIATDRTVRVVDLTAGVECDTQVDPRALAGVTDVARLACLPVGDPATPPRRALARSPGIALPRDAVPLDVQFVTVDREDPPIAEAPTDLMGTFAFVSASDGFVFLVNVDDDSYPDVEVPEDPARVHLPLALPHQLRDFVRSRSELAATCDLITRDPLQFGPRLGDPPQITVTASRVVDEKLGQLPDLRGVSCEDDDGVVAVTELDFAAPQAVREQTYGDLAAVRNELWVMTYEGNLSLDGTSESIDGPVIRRGLFSFDGGFFIEDPARPFCDAGVEPYDVVNLVGCDPAEGTSQCGVGETCYVHPESPSIVTTGQCMPADEVDALSGRCEKFLTTQRRYTVTQSYAGELKLTPRRRVLRTTPLDGCTSDAQCDELAAAEAALTDPRHPGEIPPGEPQFDWVCGADPSRAPGVDRCQMACAADDDCEAGTRCGPDGICLEGVVPPSECVAAIQRYQVRAGEAFAVVGSRTGYLHGRTRDPATDECVADPAADPLLVGRIPLRAPPCGDDPATAPNPCSTTVSQTEPVVPFAPVGGVCRGGDVEVVTREAPAIRFSNPVFTFHLVDPETQGDAVCTGDRAGDGPAYATVYPGFQLTISVTGGLFPMFVGAIEAAQPVSISRSPDGRLWVVDQGDASTTTNGRLFILDPNAAVEGFSVLVVL